MRAPVVRQPSCQRVFTLTSAFLGEIYTAGFDRFFGFDTTQRQTLENLLGDSNAALAVQVANLNAWATALATKLNADNGVTDTDYDTNPQAYTGSGR